MIILCTAPIWCEGRMMSITTGTFYSPKFCNTHRSPSARHILPRTKEWSPEEMIIFIPKYVKVLEQYMK